MIRKAIRDAIVAATLTALATKGLQWLGRRLGKRHSEKLLDESLKESFPASDPPASQNFDIPANRR